MAPVDTGPSACGPKGKPLKSLAFGSSTPQIIVYPRCTSGGETDTAKERTPAGAHHAVPRPEKPRPAALNLS